MSKPETGHPQAASVIEQARSFEKAVWGADRVLVETKNALGEMDVDIVPGAIARLAWPIGGAEGAAQAIADARRAGFEQCREMAAKAVLQTPTGQILGLTLGSGLQVISNGVANLQYQEPNNG